jgi:molybdopterin molybdotransferase
MKTRISVEEAVDIIRAGTAPLPPERRAGFDLLGLVLAENVIAPMSQPPFDRSPLDGYALIAADTADASAETPARLQIVDTVYAGGWSGVTVRPGHCVRIMTGAPIPAGADCVVRQEDTDRGDPEVAVRVRLKHHENYCSRGEDYREGEVLIPAGFPLDAAALGLLAGAGLEGAELSVRPRPRILLAGTGDELAPPGQPLRPGQIYNSNLPQLAARCRELGYTADTVQLPDDPELTARELNRGVRDYDCIITTGGVSVGEKDIFHQALPLAGAERLFWRVLLKPGTPMMFSLLAGKPVLSLSGNPFAAAATFELFARPMLAALSGDERWEPTALSAPLADDFGKKSGVRRFVRGRYTGGAVHLPEGHSSGQLRSSLGCNCLVDIPADSPALKAGKTVRVILL